jgi:hypothetical protein
VPWKENGLVSVHPRSHPALQQHCQARSTKPTHSLATQFFVASQQCLSAPAAPEASGANSATFFFPQQLSLDASRVNLDIEIRLYKSCQLNETERRIRHSHGSNGLHHFRYQFVATSGAALQRHQACQASLLEGCVGLVKRGPRKSEHVCRLGNRPVIDMYLSEHLVLDLKHVVRIEETAVPEQRMLDILRAGIQCAVLP